MRSEATSGGRGGGGDGGIVNVGHSDGVRSRFGEFVGETRSWNDTERQQQQQEEEEGLVVQAVRSEWGREGGGLTRHGYTG
ncbi:unnamed protein product [Lampetra fluviatilis]